MHYCSESYIFMLSAMSHTTLRWRLAEKCLDKKLVLWYDDIYKTFHVIWKLIWANQIALMLKLRRNRRGKISRDKVFMTKLSMCVTEYR